MPQSQTATTITTSTALNNKDHVRILTVCNIEEPRCPTVTMPRSLPWLNANGAPTKPTRTTTTTRTPAPKRARTTAPARTKSTPSSDAPPPIEYMHPSDDEWVMVEDEFLSTANLFTRSIHQAEYARMQEAASRANARQITNISRSTIGNPAIRRIQQSQA